MGQFFEYEMTVDSRDEDGWGRCRPSAVLGYLQEAATLAAEDGGFGREKTLEYHAFWMLARIWYALDRPLRWSEKVEVRTWHRGGRGAAMYRDFDLRVDGVRVGEAVSTWVLADMDTRKLFRLSGVAQFEGTDGGELCKDKLLHKPKLPEGLALAETERRLMRYSDCDINGHVNNARYADFDCDALHLENLGREAFVSQLQLGYLAECRPGEILDLEAGSLDGGCYVHGLDQNGKARFETAMIFKQLDS